MNNSPGVTIGPSVCFKVQKIIGVSVGEGNLRNYQVQWAPSWVSSLHLVGCEHLIEEYVHQNPDGYKGNPTFATNKSPHTPNMVNATKYGHHNTQHNSNMHRHHNTSNNPVHQRSHNHGANMFHEPPAYPQHQAHDRYSNLKVIPIEERETNGVNVHANDSTNPNFEWVGGRSHLNDNRSSRGPSNAPTEEQGAKSNSYQSNNSEYFTNVYPSDENANLHQVVGKESNFEEIKDEDIIVILPGDSDQQLLNENRNVPMMELSGGSSNHTPPVDKLECTICHRKLKNLSGFTQHLNKAHGIATFKCQMCNEKFESEGALRKHEHSIHGMFEEVKCRICDAVFDEQSELRAHTSQVHKKPLVGKNKCPVCDKLCISKSKLERHMRVHTGERPFKCKVCRRGFKRKDDLKKHVITHESENATEFISLNMEEDGAQNDKNNNNDDPPDDDMDADAVKGDDTEDGPFSSHSMKDKAVSETPDSDENTTLATTSKQAKKAKEEDSIMIVDAATGDIDISMEDSKSNAVDADVSQVENDEVSSKEEGAT